MAKKNQMKDIATLLPEGLTTQSVEKIAELVDKTINEQVDKKIRGLEAKVIGFLNVHMDQIQESALTQLEDRDPEFRRARLMDSIMEAVSIEVAPKDSENAITALVTEQKEAEQENDTLIAELNEALEYNTKLDRAVQTLNDKIENLEEENSALQESLETLAEQKKKPFHSMEKAVKQHADGAVGADGVDTPKQLKESVEGLLSPEIMHLMPK